MYNIINLSNTLLYISQKNNISITQMKLEKLLFFSQGWFLEIYNEPLFFNDFEAWEYGPVIPELYKIYADYLCMDIPYNDNETIIYDELYYKFLDKIINVYGVYSGTQLSMFLHKDNCPWHKLRKMYPKSKNLIINKKMIKQYIHEISEENCNDY